MQLLLAILFFITAPCAAGLESQLELSSRGPSGSSLQKVISMLASMAAKAKQEKNDEAVAFAQFSTWCTEESASLKKAIASSTSEIETLTAEIAKLDSDVKGLADSIATLESDLETFKKDEKAATEQREKDNAAFLLESQDYSESVDALERAIAVLQKESYDRPADAASLVQLSTHPNMPEKVRSILAAFVGMGQEPGFASYEAPEANAYEFQSTSIVDMLKKLQDEFRTKLGDCQKEEANSKHAYDMVVMDLKASIASAEKSISEQSGVKKRKEESSALNAKDLEATKVTLADDQKVLSEMTTECAEKKESFEEKQQLRADEIEAIEKATEVLKSPEVAANTDKYLSFSQSHASATALVQANAAKSGAASSLATQGVHRKIREFLAAEGARLHSKGLAMLAEKIAANPFAKVKSMIDAMITRLLEEANADAAHEGFCDTEMGKSKITRTKLSEDIAGLAAAVDSGKATIGQLTEQITALSAELAELEKSMVEATKLRGEEKAKNAVTVKDAKDGQAAVAAATAVLKEFYAKALTATALVQIPKMGSDEWDALANPAFEGTIDKGHKEGMQTFGEQYTGNQDGAAGVMALLEVIQSDFANLEAETMASEEASQTAYEAFMTESKKSKATKTKQVEMNTADKTRAEEKLEQDTQDMKATQDELLAADRYYEKLVPQCVDQGMTFEERTAAREAEIKSLKEALSILSNPDIVTSA